MSRFVADTHALYWHFADDDRISPLAKNLFLLVDLGQHTVYVPSIAIVEMIYLSERGKMEIEPIQRLVTILNDVTDNYLVADLGLDIVTALARVPRSAVADMPDRIIVATALELGLPLISRDAAIVASNVVSTIW